MSSPNHDDVSTTVVCSSPMHAVIKTERRELFYVCVFLIDGYPRYST